MNLLKMCARVVLVGALLSSLIAYADDQRLVLTGSSTVAPLALEIGKRFEEKNPGVRVDVQTGGSSRGIVDARSGMADIGMASRALVNSEQALFAHTIALDGIALIVNAENPVARLTDDQVKAIYLGRISNWQEVGGVDKSITVVNKAEGRSTLELFLAHFKLSNRDIKASVVIGDNQQGIKTVAGNPYAIAYVSIGSAEFEAINDTPIRLLPMKGVPASVAQVQAGQFPLSRPLNLVTKSQPADLVERFIAFSQSTVVHDLIADQYFVPVTNAFR